MHICAPFYSAAVRSGLRRETWGRSLRAIMATSAVPATLKPSATLVCLQPWVTAEPTDLEDDMAAAMRAAVKKARGAAAPKTPRKQCLRLRLRRLQRQQGGQTTEQVSRHAQEGRGWKKDRGATGPPSGALGSWVRHCSSPNLHLDFKKRGQDLFGRAPHEADRRQVPNYGTADLLLSQWS